jgi:threonine/homoserine/homoserine lactone efflux protein
LYLSLIPQFVRPEQGHVLAQGFLFGGVQIAVSMTVNLLIVAAAGTIAVFLGRRPGWLRAQRWLMSTVLGSLAVRLAVERSPSHA